VTGMAVARIESFIGEVGATTCRGQ
jgi:hypothetical protein